MTTEPFSSSSQSILSTGGSGFDNSSSGKRRGRRDVIDVGQLFDRLPPQAIEAEMALLGSMILDPMVIGEVIQIVRTAEDYSRPAHGAIHQCLVELYDTHNTGDIALLHQKLVDRGMAEDVGSPDYLMQLAESTPAAINAVHYARVVADKAIVRRLIAAAGNILHTAYHAADDVRHVLDAAERVIFEVAERAQSREAQSLSDLLQETMTAIQSRGEGEITGVRTCYREFDEMTSGMQPGELIILAARPSMGKTAFALNVVENIGLMGTAVGFFSLEMSRQQLAERLLCSNAQIDSHRLRRNRIREDEWSRLAFSVGNLSEAPIYIDDTPGISILELRAKARRLVARHDVKIIAIDYLQLLTGSNRESRQQEVSEISRGIKGLARELNIPVLCLSQLNRAAENREDHRPRLSDLRESGSIEQDADVVMMLHREDYYNQHQDDFIPSNIAEIIIAKQRNGPTGTTKLTWVGASMKFKDFTPQAPPPGFSGASGGSSYGGASSTAEVQPPYRSSPPTQSPAARPADVGDIPI